jgi:protein-disulfide isomerase
MSSIKMWAAVPILAMAFGIAATGPALAQDRSVVAQAPAAQGALFEERILGRPDAPVTIYEFASMTCPHCATFHNDILPQIKAAYIDTGKVKLVMREFPFDRAALAGAMVARCLPAERFYPFLDVLFKTQRQWATAQDPARPLQQNARLAGMSEADFQACVSNGQLADWILQRRLDATNQFRVESTPTFVFNDGKERIVGAMPFEDFKKVIDRLLPPG